MGGGCTVTLSDPWTNTNMTGNARKIRLNSCLYIFRKAETFFIGIIEHMYRHQFWDSYYLRTQVMAQNVISRFRWRPFWKWPKTGSPSQLFLWHRLLLSGKVQGANKTLSQTVVGKGMHGNPIWPIDYKVSVPRIWRWSARIIISFTRGEKFTTDWNAGIDTNS